jgi:hypothetical protein
MTDLTSPAPEMTELAEKHVRDRHTFGFVVVDEIDVVNMDAPFSDFLRALQQRAEHLNAVLKVEHVLATRRFEISWRPCRGDEQPSVSTIS